MVVQMVVQQFLAALRQRGAQRLSLPGDQTLAPDVLGPSGGFLHSHRLKPESAQVVRAGLHVQGASLGGQVQAGQQQAGVDERSQLVAPLVQVHVRVQAARLLPPALRLPGGAAFVAGYSRFGEEAEGVEVAAAQRHRLDDGVGSGRAQPQRHPAVTDLPGAVDHRPLVHAEAAEPGRPGGRRTQQAHDEPHRVETGPQVVRADRHPVGGRHITGPVQIPACSRAGQHGAVAGMPQP